MYNRFSVDLASELRPSDCIDFKFLMLFPLNQPNIIYLYTNIIYI